MKLKLTLATSITVNGKTLNAFKCICTENRITLFISTVSLKSAYNLEVQPLGNIRGTDVVDVQGFFDAVEEAAANRTDMQALFTYMELTLGGGAGTAYEDLLKAVDFNRIPKKTQLAIFKSATATLDERWMLQAADFEWLKKKYGRR